MNKKATEKLGGNFVWEELLLDSLNGLFDDLFNSLGDLLAGLAGLVSDLLASLGLADLLFAKLVLEHLGEQEITTDSGSSHTDHDTDDDPEGVVILLLFLVEVEHGEYPPFLIGKRELSHILGNIIAENRELRMNILHF